MDTITKTWINFNDGIKIDSAGTYFLSYSAPGSNVYTYYFESFSNIKINKDTINWCGPAYSIPLNNCRFSF